MSQFQAGQAVVDFKAGGQKAFTGAAGKMGKVMDRFKARATRAINAVKKGFVIGGAAVGAALLFSVKAAADFEKSQATLVAVHKATENAAGKSIVQLNKQAKAMRNLTGVSKNLITDGQAILLTFKEIKGANFDQALESALDMNAVIGGPLKGSLIQLGKALNDPVRGIGALSEIGVSFSLQQKNLIRALDETGDRAGAQAVILKELQSEFGGAARAAGQTFAGQLAIAKGQLTDVAEAIGVGLIPGLKAMTKELSSNADAMQAWGESIGTSIGTAINWIVKYKDAFLLQIKRVVIAGALFVSEFVDQLANAFKFVIEMATTWGSNFVIIMQNVASNAIQIFTNVFQNTMPGLLTGFQTFFIDIFMNIQRVSVEVFKNMGGIAAGFFNTVTSGSLKPLQQALDVAGQDIKNVLKPVGDPFSNINLDVLKDTKNILEGINQAGLTPDKKSFITNVLAETLKDIDRQITALENKGSAQPGDQSLLKERKSAGDADKDAADATKSAASKFGDIVQNFKRIQTNITGGESPEAQRKKQIDEQKKTKKAVEDGAEDIVEAVAKAAMGASSAFIPGS